MTAVSETQAAEQEVDRKILAFVGALSPDDRDRVVHFSSPPYAEWLAGELQTITIRQIAWHLVEEELQHRGDLNALLGQLGREQPIAEWIEWWNSRVHS